MKDFLELIKLNVKLLVVKLKIMWVKLKIELEDIQKRIDMVKAYTR